MPAKAGIQQSLLFRLYLLRLRLLGPRLRGDDTEFLFHAASCVSTSRIQYEVPYRIASSLKL